MRVGQSQGKEGGLAPAVFGFAIGFLGQATTFTCLQIDVMLALRKKLQT